MDVPAYLDPRAKEMLSRARNTAREARLDHQPFMQDGSEVVWFTWAGTRIQRTLTVIGMHIGGFKVEDQRGIALFFEKATIASVVECYRRALTTHLDPETLAKQFACRASVKYESFLSDDLQARLFGRDHLDLDGAIFKIEYLS